MGGASFLIYMCGFVGELVAGWISDKWKDRGGAPNVVFRTMFGIAAVISTCRSSPSPTCPTRSSR